MAGKPEDGDEHRHTVTPTSAWTAVVAGRQHSGKSFSPASARNTEVILAELRDLLPAAGTALELASGTGQHICAYAQAFPAITWQPSDVDADALASIAAWREEAALDNLLPPQLLDLSSTDWQHQAGGPYDLIIAANLLHISPWEVSLALFQGAAKILAPNGLLFVYGCFARAGDPVSDSNQEFDHSLRRRNHLWGIRDTDDTAKAVESIGLKQTQIIEMSANNTVIVVRRQG